METANAFHRVDPHLIDDDPFWGRVRRRHPDVDIVLLPSAADDAHASPTPTGPDATASAAEVEGVVAGVRAAWRDLVHPLIRDAAGSSLPSVRWKHLAERRSLLVRKAVAGLGQEAGNELLRRLVLGLHEGGWQIAPGAPTGSAGADDLPAFRATDGSLALEAVAGPGATVVTLVGWPLAMAGEPDPQVLDHLRKELASWQ